MTPFRLTSTGSLSQRALPLRPAGAPLPAPHAPVLRRPVPPGRPLTTEADDGR